MICCGEMTRLFGLLALAALVGAAGAQEAVEMPPAEQAEQLLGVHDDAAEADESAAEAVGKLDRLEVRQVYQNYMQAEQFDEAIDAARAGLELTVAEFGPSHLETVPYLNDVGFALLHTGVPAEARVAFEQAVAIVKVEAGIFSDQLIEPLDGLGLSLQRLGEHDLAIQTFQYAQHVTHRTEGVNSLNQIQIIDAASRSFMAQEKWQQAESLQLLVYKLYRRNYGVGTVDSIPGLYRLARWYHEVGDYRQARVLLKESLEIQQLEYGGDSPEMIPGLKGIAAAYLEESGPDAIKGLRAQKRLLAIIGDHPERFSPRDQVLAHLEMGDWHVQFNQEKEAWEEYRAGWELAQDDGESPRDWDAYFERPHLIYPGATLGIDLMGYGRAGDEVYYDFEFTVSASGRPEKINVLGTNLHGQTRAVAIQAFRYARFRPRIVDGVAMATAGYKVRRIYPTGAPDGTVAFGKRG